MLIPRQPNIDADAMVIDTVDVHNHGRMRAVFACAGMDYALCTTDDAYENLVGKSVQILTKNFTPIKGRHKGIRKACVGQWIVGSISDFETEGF